MKLKRSIVGAGVGLLLAAVPVLAHHQYTMEFDPTKPVTLRGTLTRMDWVHPHGWIYIDVRDPDGKGVNWTIEIGSPNALRGRGLLKTDFSPGLEVVVTGYRSKNNAPIALGWTIIFPDGRSFLLTGSGNGVSTSGPERSERQSPN